MRFLLAFLIGAHGIAHLVGFVASWRLATLEGLHYKTTALADTVDIGDGGTRLVGVLWLAAAIAFVVAAAGVAIDANWTHRLMTIAVIGSMALCIVGWPEARIGVFVNVILGLLLILAPRLNL
jgi:hypothetical protein